MYFRLAKFVDKFGARPSGSEVLEQSIDYMIQLTKDEDLNNINTEELEVRALHVTSLRYTSDI